jgi:hypothetical protein
MWRWNKAVGVMFAAALMVVASVAAQNSAKSAKPTIEQLFDILISMPDQPKLFHAGVDVAGVVGYMMNYSDPYHGDWTASRSGTPEQNPQVYANALPISHFDRLAYRRSTKKGQR